MDIVTLALAKGYTNKKIAESESAGITRKIVDELPASGENNVIYMVPNGGEVPNFYDEYMWINSKWEKIGSTDTGGDESVLEAMTAADFCPPVADSDNKLYITNDSEVYVL